ncbi:FAD-dependent thymidylate synthase [Fusibacter bizertensis]|uniref:Flavin-dependent thymidylate synthase n=1 Tax=Fusibacter bizertensis TaxID=1488331 RepID=A0ABT6NHG4_9FIRM|nr:FAD-dependent thymidylate synthase [Fusibacter bizertensis]MDH8679883.1 FAD-dependent thymidylate synthase [Fusibacter bizertensis]
MTINLIAYTPDPEKVVAAAAKLCYSQSGADDIMSNLEEQQTTAFLGKLMDFGHYSPLEHVSFTFAIEGVSRVLTHQLVRHRIASYSQQSQRYVKLDQFEYIVPPAIESSPKAKAIFVKAMEDDQEVYSKLVDLLEAEYNIKNLEAGMSAKKAKASAEKSAIEDARFVFPNACETKIVMTMNARSLINFFNHRCCTRAQWEIRALADELLKTVKAVAPTLFEGAGPKCITGPCPEGKMTCGKIEAVRQKYTEL